MHRKKLAQFTEPADALNKMLVEPETFEEAIDAVLAEMRQIMLAKRHDYGKVGKTRTSVIADA